MSHARGVLSVWAPRAILGLLVPELGLKLQREFSGAGVGQVLRSPAGCYLHTESVFSGFGEQKMKGSDIERC